MKLNVINNSEFPIVTKFCSLDYGEFFMFRDDVEQFDAPVYIKISKTKLFSFYTMQDTYIGEGDIDNFLVYPLKAALTVTY